MLKTVGLGLLGNAKKNIFSNFIRSISGHYSTGNVIDAEKVVCGKWKAYNNKIYPPQAPDEPRRPGYICHVTEAVKYSYKRMWYVATFIRGMSVDEALKQLKFIKQKGAEIATEALLKAQEKAVEEHNIEYKTNLWVSESFVGKSNRIKGLRRCAKGRMSVVHYDYIHYFLTLEEGNPPEYYYYYKRPKSGNEMLEEWLEEMRNRKVIEGL